MENYHIKKKLFVNRFSEIMYEKITNDRNEEIIFLCIGTDRITGDCLGPLVGSKLKRMLEYYNIYNVIVYGCLEEPISYTNAERYIKFIKENYKNPCIVVVDAALSKKENIGKIYITKEKTILGKGINKNTLTIGDISIKAVVGKDYKIPKYNFNILQNISLNSVMQLSNILADGIYETIQYG